METKGTLTFWVTWAGFVAGCTVLLTCTLMIVLTPRTAICPGCEEDVAQDVGYLTDMLGAPFIREDPIGHPWPLPDLTAWEEHEGYEVQVEW